MAITPKSEDRYVEKCSTAQSFIRTEMSTYGIGTLDHFSIFIIIFKPKMSISKAEILVHL